MNVSLHCWDMSLPQTYQAWCAQLQEACHVVQHCTGSYIDPVWVALEYLKRCSKGSWKKENDVDALKCWNLERIISAELLNQPQPDEMTMDEFIAECGEWGGGLRCLHFGGQFVVCFHFSS